MIFRRRMWVEGDAIAANELSTKLKELECRVKSLEYELESQKMSAEILALTVKDRVSHQMVHNPNDFFNNYGERAADLFDRGYAIRKTFKKGEWELWIKRE